MLQPEQGSDKGTRILEAMPTLHQASQPIHSITTIDALSSTSWASDSSDGTAIDNSGGSTPNHSTLMPLGDEINTAAGFAPLTQMTGIESLQWQAHQDLSNHPVIPVIDSQEQSATEFGITGWNTETGFEAIGLVAAIDLAKQTKPNGAEAAAAIATTRVDYSRLIPISWATTDEMTTGERPTDDWSEPLPETNPDNGSSGNGAAAPPSNPPADNENTASDGNADTDSSPTGSTDADPDASTNSTDESTGSSSTGTDLENSDASEGDSEFDSTDSGSETTDSTDGSTSDETGNDSTDSGTNEESSTDPDASNDSWNDSTVDSDEDSDTTDGINSASGDGYGGEQVGSGYGDGSTSGSGYGNDSSGSGYGNDSTTGSGYGDESGGSGGTTDQDGQGALTPDDVFAESKIDAYYFGDGSSGAGGSSGSSGDSPSNPPDPGSGGLGGGSGGGSGSGSGSGYPLFSQEEFDIDTSLYVGSWDGANDFYEGQAFGYRPQFRPDDGTFVAFNSVRDYHFLSDYYWSAYYYGYYKQDPPPNDPGSPNPPGPGMSPPNPDQPPALSYEQRLQLLLDSTVGKLEGTKQAALTGEMDGLRAVGRLVDQNGLYKAMYPVFSRVFTTADEIKATFGIQRQVPVLTWNLQQLTESVKAEAYTAKLLVAAAQLPQFASLQQNDYQLFDQNAVYLLDVIQKLGHTYASLRPTIDSSATDGEDSCFLNVLFRAQDEQAIQAGKDELAAALEGISNPTRALLFVRNLLEAAKLVPALREQVQDGQFINELVKLGLAYAKLNPGYPESSEPLHFFMDTLWQSTDSPYGYVLQDNSLKPQIRQAATELSSFLTEFDTDEKRLKLIEFETNLIDAANQVPQLEYQVSNPTFLSKLVALGNTYAVLAPSAGEPVFPLLLNETDPDAPSSSELFLDTLWRSQNDSDRSQGVQEFSRFLGDFQNSTRLLDQGCGLLSAIRCLPEEFETQKQDAGFISSILNTGKNYLFPDSTNTSPEDLSDPEAEFYREISFTDNSQINGQKLASLSFGSRLISSQGKVEFFRLDSNLRLTIPLPVFFPLVVEPPNLNLRYRLPIYDANGKHTDKLFKSFSISRGNWNQNETYPGNTLIQVRLTHDGQQPPRGTVYLYPGDSVYVPASDLKLRSLNLIDVFLPTLFDTIAPPPDSRPARLTDYQLRLQTVADLTFRKILADGIALPGFSPESVQELLNDPNALAQVAESMLKVGALLVSLQVANNIAPGLLTQFLISSGILSKVVEQIPEIDVFIQTWKAKTVGDLLNKAVPQFENVLLGVLLSPLFAGVTIVGESTGSLLSKFFRGLGEGLGEFVRGGLSKESALRGALTTRRFVSSAVDELATKVGDEPILAVMQGLSDEELAKRFNTLQEIANSVRTNSELTDAIAQYPNSIGAMLEFGSEAVTVLAERSTRMRDFLPVWTKRLSEISAQEGADILEGVQYTLRKRSEINAPSGIGRTKNVGYGEFTVELPNGHQIVGNRDNFIAIAGDQDVYPNTLPVPQERIFTPGNVNATHSEVKVLEAIAKQIKDAGIQPNQYNSLRGNVTLFTERGPCDECIPVIYQQWKDTFPGVEIKVLHGPRYLPGDATDLN